MTSAALLVEYIQRGVISIDEARERMSLPKVTQPAAPDRVACSYCQAAVSGDRCKNCGAPR